jgi:hypothetical protein
VLVWAELTLGPGYQPLQWHRGGWLSSCGQLGRELAGSSFPKLSGDGEGVLS